MELYTWKPNTFLMDKRVIKEHVCEKKDKMKHTAYSCRIWQQKDNVEAKQFADNLERQGY